MINSTTHATLPMTRTIILCAISSIITSLIVLHQWWIAIIPILFCLLTCWYRAKARIKTVAFCALSALCVVLRIQQLENSFLHDRTMLETPVTIAGRVELLQQNLQDRATVNLIVQTEIVDHPNFKDQSLRKTILIQMPQKCARDFKVGDCALWHDVILQQPKQSQSAYRWYLIKEGIWATAYLYKPKFHIISDCKPLRHHQIFNYLSNHFKGITRYLYNPLFLGKKEKDALSLTIQHQSSYWGIAHHMARSGIHLATVLGLCIAIFHYARFRSRIRFALYALLVIGYAMISIATISFVRSLMMIMIQMFSKINGFQYSGIHAFALTTVLTILYNPFQVIFLDFQLSFGITAVIIWLFYIKWAKTVDFPLVSLLRC